MGRTALGRGRRPLGGRPTELSFTGRTPAWHAKAACADADPDLFYPESRKSLAEELTAAAPALAYCARCSVRRRCLDDALAHETDGSRFGVWGGTVPKQRAALALESTPAAKSRQLDGQAEITAV
jgi:WhiB family transcriptional regulator, redox-sensing transcriptional regulator